MKQLKKIIICADDFGLSSGICAGIIKLVTMNRLSAVSCMVHTKSFSKYIPELVALSQQHDVQLGLHFNLTEGFLLSQPTKPCFDLVPLLMMSHGHCLSQQLIERELIFQLELFLEHTGRWPDFIDGHQHVHQFPVIRAILLKVYEQSLRVHAPWLRATFPIQSLPRFRRKEHILSYTGGRSFKRLLEKHQIQHNASFAGIYDFSPAADYPVLFKQWLHAAPEQTLIMCHPGEGVAPDDVIAKARLNEMAYLSSERFLEDCSSASPRAGQ